MDKATSIHMSPRSYQSVPLTGRDKFCHKKLELYFMRVLWLTYTPSFHSERKTFSAGQPIGMYYFFTLPLFYLSIIFSLEIV